ncbi:MAG: hypothetical protein IT440_00225 [Phycisphaeraceae bacterium]|nr:hypothetical protein [Phycisphaeraceae bacterium]
MDHPVLIVLMRFLHITGAILAVGGLSFIAACFRPSLKSLPQDQRDALAGAVRGRFLKVQLIAIALLVISGVYGWILSAAAYKAIGPAANAMIGIKVLLALILFAVVWMRSSGILKSDKLAGMINLHLAAVIILLAGILRYLQLYHGAA